VPGSCSPPSAFFVVGGMYRWEKYVPVQWVLLAFGLFVMALAMAWGFIYTNPVVHRIAESIAIVALMLFAIALGIWLDLHPTES
jgi:hypothetical protein